MEENNTTEVEHENSFLRFMKNVFGLKCGDRFYLYNVKDSSEEPTEYWLDVERIRRVRHEWMGVRELIPDMLYANLKVVKVHLPKMGEVYYYYSADKCIHKYKNDYSEFHLYNVYFGNCFRNADEAMVAKDAICKDIVHIFSKCKEREKSLAEDVKPITNSPFLRMMEGYGVGLRELFRVAGRDTEWEDEYFIVNELCISQWLYENNAAWDKYNDVLSYVVEKPETLIPVFYPAPNEIYYFVKADGEVHSRKNKLKLADYHHMKVNNCFKTKEQAEHLSQYYADLIEITKTRCITG